MKDITLQIKEIGGVWDTYGDNEEEILIEVEDASKYELDTNYIYRYIKNNKIIYQKIVVVKCQGWFGYGGGFYDTTCDMIYKLENGKLEYLTYEAH